MSETNTYEFKAEARQLLDLMVHSVYSHREIFLRELISNASDALDKLRFAALTDERLRDATGDLHIRLSVGRDPKRLVVEDNGIGMNRSELIEFIGTIARSGTRDYARLLRESRDQAAAVELIGQFGVGFYSSFMVASRVIVVSRRAGESEAWRWISTGDGTFTIEPAERECCGTTVTLELKTFADEDDVPDFSSEWTVRELVRKYSDFVSYPIRMRTERTETPKDGKGETKTVVEDQTLNSMKAIWARPEKEVSETEYIEFYKHLTHDWNPPLRWVSFRAEGAEAEFRALFYFPEKPLPEIFVAEEQRGIHLYIRRVFIMRDCEELIPEYLRWVRGVVDAESLSLNISREILQKDRQIGSIRKALTHKVLATLKSMRQDESEKYSKLWASFGRVIKEGLFREAGDRERIFDAALFQTTAGNESRSLDQVIEAMKPDQKALYFLTGESPAAVATSPHLEAFRARGIEVLLLTDPVDEVWTQYVHEVRGKPLKSVARGELDLGPAPGAAEGEQDRKAQEAEKKPLLEKLKAALADHVKDVRLSARLTTSPACLVSDEHDLSPQVEAMLRASGKEVPRVKRILELNAAHPLLARLQKIHAANADDRRLGEYAELLFGQAILVEGGRPPDPARFAMLIAQLMTQGE